MHDSISSLLYPRNNYSCHNMQATYQYFELQITAFSFFPQSSSLSASKRVAGTTLSDTVSARVSASSACSAVTTTIPIERAAFHQQLAMMPQRQHRHQSFPCLYRADEEKRIPTSPWPGNRNRKKHELANSLTHNFVSKKELHLIKMTVKTKIQIR